MKRTRQLPARRTVKLFEIKRPGPLTVIAVILGTVMAYLLVVALVVGVCAAVIFEAYRIFLR